MGSSARALAFALSLAGGSAALPGAESADVQLYDGRELTAARLLEITETHVTLVHSGGVIAVPTDSVPLDFLARSYDEVVARRELRAKRADVWKQEDGDTRHPPQGRPKSWLNSGAKFALVATGEPGPRRLPENGCVIASNAAGTGTGFILRQKQGFVLVTNQHVVNGGAPHRYELADGSETRPLAGLIAADRDLVILALGDGPFPHYFEMEADVSQVAIGEELLIYGNSLGRGIRASQAKLVAKNQTQIEVSGGIVSGNSGGPILRAKTGKVIGVSTYVTVREDAPRTIQELVARSTLPKVQYYSVRIDTLGSYADFDLRSFLGERDALEADARRLHRSIALLGLMAQRLRGHDPGVSPYARDADPEVRRVVDLLRSPSSTPVGSVLST